MCVCVCVCVCTVSEEDEAVDAAAVKGVRRRASAARGEDSALAAVDITTPLRDDEVSE